ncbi:hypothetical protein P879_02420 [Paragonimus westermani]|uniref:Striatin N-terminal domain-containing protein n=1 Tax=Paragonimus westermani TaxID=34504 RepID=A0A8T0DG84_9TREM|nr:hypothetical protein P879_02420 [Paragonimus westermani]
MDTCLLAQTTSNESEKEAEEFVRHQSPTSNPMGCYTLTGILEYLQDQWAKMDMERSEWAVERAELQARIAFLQGECKGQENLKVDLVRRIKMLEYALLQERAKNFELKYPYETKVVLSSINGAADELGDDPNRATSQVDVEGIRWREERVRLKDYLISAGLGDAMARLRETRVRDLLAKTTAVDTANETPAPPVPTTDSANLNPPESLSLSDSNLSQENIKNASTVTNFPVFSKDTSPNTGLSEILLSYPNYEGSISGLGDTLDVTDPETAEALAEFELLVSQQGLIGRISPAGGGDTIVPEFPQDSDNLYQNMRVVCKDWDAMQDKELLTRFKEQYRAERSTRQTGHSVGFVSPRNSFELQHPASTNARLDLELPTSHLCGDIDVKRPFLDKYPYSARPLASDEIDEVTAEYEAILSTEPDPSRHSELLALRALHPADTASPSDATGLPTDPNRSAGSVLSLGDLASLTVTNDSDSLHTHPTAVAMDNLDGVGDLLQSGSTPDSLASGSVVVPHTTETPPWTAKYTLRSHFDAIRSIGFHPVEPILLTASEDHTLKLWNLNKTVQTKKSINLDVEPVYTFRGHENPVLSLAMWAGAEPVNSSALLVYSGDLRGHLRSWRLSSLQMDPYDTFEPAVSGPLFRGHSDAIWSLAVRSDGVLLSASADGTACLWSAAHCAVHRAGSSHLSIPASNVFQLTTSLMAALAVRSVELGSRAPVPTSLAFIPTERNRFLSGFTSGHLCLFDIETNQLVSSFPTQSKTDLSVSDSKPPGAVTCVVAHPTQSLVISAHEDRHIRFFDIHNGSCVHSMVAHLDSVTGLSVDPHGVYLLSASHDCSIRLWNINKKTCIQEITSHRKKFGESIHAVAFHPTKHLMASAGADALAKVFT